MLFYEKLANLTTLDLVNCHKYRIACIKGKTTYLGWVTYALYPLQLFQEAVINHNFLANISSGEAFLWLSKTQRHLYNIKWTDGQSQCSGCSRGPYQSQFHHVSYDLSFCCHKSSRPDDNHWKANTDKPLLIVPQFTVSPYLPGLIHFFQIPGSCVKKCLFYFNSIYRIPLYAVKR